MYKRSIFLVLVSLVSMTMWVGCYQYGPIHDPYRGQQKRNVPPPPTKKIAAPYSKSEYMQKTFTEIQNALPEAEVKLIEDSIKVLFPNNIIYNRGEVYPNSNYQTPIRTFCQLLKKYNKTDILVTGHTDSRGDKQKNRMLSEQRAKNIVSILNDYQVNRSRLNAMGLGDLSPIADNASEEGRAINRRVEFVVLYRE